MATETELLEQYNYLQSQIEAKRAEIETLRQMQGVIKETMPRLCYIYGFGQQGLERGILFAGTEDECKAWIAQQPEHEIVENGEQIRRKNVPQVGSYPVAGLIRSVTPVDKGWREISDMVEAAKKRKSDALSNRNS